MYRWIGFKHPLACEVSKVGFLEDLESQSHNTVTHTTVSLEQGATELEKMT